MDRPAVALMLAAICQAAGAEEGLDPKAFAKLKSSDAMVRLGAAKEVMKSRAETIASLLRVAQEKEKETLPDGTKELAIDLLGQYRAAEASTFLVKNLAFRVPYERRADDPIRGYPCARALIAIGPASFPEIWSRLKLPVTKKEEKRDEDLEIMLIAYVVRAVDGHEFGLARLEVIRAGASERTQSDNFDRLIAHFRSKRTGF